MRRFNQYRAIAIARRWHDHRVGFYRHSNPFDHVIGPALRMIIDAIRAFRVCSSFRAVGSPVSPHYRDQLDLWHCGQDPAFSGLRAP